LICFWVIGGLSAGAYASEVLAWSAATLKGVNMSFFVIIVVVPYLIVLVGFLKPYWLEQFVREWPWEERRVAGDVRQNKPLDHSS
jgi:hypothetical protein